MSEVLRLDAIVRDGRTQIRGAFYDTIAQEYADAMKAGAVFPDIAVFFDGEKYYLADGFHRVEAARLAGSEVISAQVLPGGVRDAILFAVGANAKHGIRRTNEDKRLAVKALLSDPEWRQWSDHEIARRAQVDPKTVGNIRKGMEASGEIPQVEIRQTANGVTMDTASIGGKPKALNPDPSPSERGEERQDGQAAGKISPEMWYPVDHRSKVVYDDPSGSQELARVRVLYHSLVNIKGKDALQHIQRGYSIKEPPGYAPQTIEAKWPKFRVSVSYPVDLMNKIIYDAPMSKIWAAQIMKTYPDCQAVPGEIIYQYWHDVVVRYGEYEVRPAREALTPDPSPSWRGEKDKTGRASHDPYGDAGEEEVDPADEMEDEEGSEIEEDTEQGEEPGWDNQTEAFIEDLIRKLEWLDDHWEENAAYLESEEFGRAYHDSRELDILIRRVSDVVRTLKAERESHE